MTNDRIDQLRDMVLEEKRVQVTDLSERLGVSEVTIRKDLTLLEETGFLLRRHGGAVLAENPKQVMDHVKRLNVLRKEKLTIARFTADEIRDGENLLLDSGSTTLALSQELRSRGTKVRIVTNSLAIAYGLLDATDIVLEVISGTLRHSSGAIIGPRARQALERIRVDRVFLGCAGFDPKLGFSSENAVEAGTKASMLSCGGEITILADHSKFDRPAFASFAEPGQVHRVITDKRLPKVASSALKRAGVKILTAKTRREGVQS